MKLCNGNYPEAIPALARIWHSVLGSIWVPDISIERVEQRFHEHLNDALLPITFVAFDGSKLVGSVSLRENDGIRPHLTPWLGSLVVDKAYQKYGIGKMLIDTTKQKAIELDVKKLYLFTFDPTLPAYYGQQGFNKIGMDEFRGHPVTVMETML
ncbi:GNAT family N-acetyltransferase [Legionella tunisiensis]|uniref:GNAT family N-acetyltransferase n=1 Tax=Legionella tunisiensis TaxID=1034944 RepID=UPI00030A6AC2|nr:GNAT family N-acetyltransferase [Legionella tunisiensis]